MKVIKDSPTLPSLKSTCAHCKATLRVYVKDVFCRLESHTGKFLWSYPCGVCGKQNSIDHADTPESWYPYKNQLGLIQH